MPFICNVKIKFSWSKSCKYMFGNGMPEKMSYGEFVVGGRKTMVGKFGGR
jgi:hypothetical protein